MDRVKEHVKRLLTFNRADHEGFVLTPKDLSNSFSVDELRSLGQLFTEAADMKTKAGQMTRGASVQVHAPHRICGRATRQEFMDCQGLVAQVASQVSCS